MSDLEDALEDFCLLQDDVTPLDEDSFATIEIDDRLTLKARLDQFCAGRRWELSALPSSELACSTILLVHPMTELTDSSFLDEVAQSEASAIDAQPVSEETNSAMDPQPEEKNEQEEESDGMDEWLVMSSDAPDSPLMTSSVLAQKMNRVRSFFGSRRNQNAEPSNQKIIPPTNSTPKKRASQSPIPTKLCDAKLCTNRNDLRSCYKCGGNFCENHCRPAGAMQSAGWKRQLQCVANTEDDVLFDMLEREHALICARCEENFFQSSGQMVDHTKRFLALRDQSKQMRQELISSHLSTISKTLLSVQKEMENAPIATSLSEGLGSLNVMKSITWRVKETYSQCGLCEEFFERFSIRNTCQLCRLIFCQSCGVSVVRFAPQLFPETRSLEGYIQVQACTRCRLALGLQSRQRRYQRCKLSQRIDLIQERHDQVQQHRDRLDQLIEQYYSFLEASPAALQCKGAIESEMNFYESRSRSLEVMARQPLKSNLNRTETRFLRALENAHHGYIRDRLGLFRLQSKTLQLRSQESDL